MGAMKKITVIVFFAIFAGFAAPPPSVPGTKLTNEMYFEHLMSRRPQNNAPEIDDSLQQPAQNVRSPQLSWQSLPVHDQLAQDTTTIRHGNGAVFVPQMSAVGNTEPNFYIYTSEDERVTAGETGVKINLLPGRYMLKIIENVPFDIIQEFEIRAGEITPIMPSWAAVRIEVIDETGKPIRGEYDLAILDPLMAIGRGRGRDIDLAENLRIWFLPVGYYKIVGVGSPLNSISNFLTFRVVEEGEYIRYTIVQDVETRRILGGGIIFADIAAQTGRRANWSSAMNIGGSIDFNYHRDDFLDTTANLTKFSLLLYTRNNYHKNKLDIMMLSRVDVGFLLDDMKWKTLRTTSDEFRINALFTYRLFSRSGPYWRGEFSSSVFPKASSFHNISSHAFLLFDNIPDTIGDNAQVIIDTVSLSMRTSPAFSPIQLQMGGGYNFQIIKNRILDLRFLSGGGIEYEKQRNSWKAVSERYLNFDTSSAIYQNIYDRNMERITLEKNDGERFDYGPEFMLNYFAYFTRHISVDGSVRLFLPTARFSTPDLRSHTLLSFRLTRFFNIDYDYTFDLIQATQEELRTKSNKHRILGRFSFARR